jgi:hypothetical protein
MTRNLSCKKGLTDISGDADEPGPARPDLGPAGWRALVQPADLPCALLNGLIALGAAVAATVLGLVAVISSMGGRIQADPGDVFAAAVWVTGASLGVPVRERVSITAPGGHDLLTTTTEVRAIAWPLTGIVVVMIFCLVRRRERIRPAARLGQRAVRAALTALALPLVLLVLSLATTRASVFGFPFGAAGLPGSHASSSIGLQPGLVFAGPLLLTAAAALAGAGAVAQMPQRAAAELARWRAVLRVAWRQTTVTGAVTGVTLLVYATAKAGQHGSDRMIVIIIGLLLLLPNLAIYGTLGGFGTTFYGTMTFASPGPGRQPGAASYSIGIFGSFRPWIVWLLLAAAVVGALAPALLARRAARAGHRGSAHNPLTGVWRAAVTGLLTATAAVLLGALSYTASGAGFADGPVHTSASAGPSLLAAAGLTAAWLSTGYLVASVALPVTTDLRRRPPQPP